MPWFIAVLFAFIILCEAIALYIGISIIRGYSRERERTRNVHNLQVSELLDRLAHKQGVPYNLPDRKLTAEPPANLHDLSGEELEELLNWREV